MINTILRELINTILNKSKVAKEYHILVSKQVLSLAYFHLSSRVTLIFEYILKNQ